MNANIGEVFVARDVQIDLEDLSMVESSAVFVVLDNKTVERVDTAHAHKWHVPANEREYNNSPQRDLWRTAKELKMDDYAKIRMYNLVLKSSVDLGKHTIYRTYARCGRTRSSSRMPGSSSTSSTLGGVSKVGRWIATSSSPMRR